VLEQRRLVIDSPSRSPARESWVSLRRHTPARIALGRAGCGLPVKAHLDFQAAHARARDAVHAALDVAALAEKIACGSPVLVVQSQAQDRHAFLRFPDLGRRLSPASQALLSEPLVAPEVVIVVGDGLSSVAVERNAVPLLEILCARLRGIGLQVGPIVLATQARVALADQIGELMQAKVAVMLIGERPGLSAADSLGMYLTYDPKVGRVDSERNCISNIHARGMSAEQAAEQAVELIKAMLLHRAAGIALFGKRKLSGPEK
jgi:ethanolamine ammonia-lyase small subunit